MKDNTTGNTDKELSSAGMPKAVPGEKGSDIITPAIVANMTEGDHEAFRIIYQHSFGPLTDFLTLLLHSTDRAMDVAQKVFADLWENRAKINPSKNFKGYLYTVAKNGALMDMRQRRLDQKYYDHTITSTPDFPVEPDQVVMTAELVTMINIYIENMPEQRKRVYAMSQNDGMSDKEIADRLNISEVTVRTHRHQALKGIKDLTALCILLFFS